MEERQDLISRQVAIDALDKRFDDAPMELTTEILQLRRDLRERIPSAQPATNCSEIPNGSDDTISRQAALKELAAYIHLIDKTMGKGTLTDDDCMEAAKSVLGEDELPAAQPDHTTDSGKMACVDTISRRAAIDVLHGYFDGMLETDTWSPCDVYGSIEMLPSVQPKQVCVATVMLTDEQVKEAVEKAKNAVVSVIESEPHWISCSERLPEENGQYLITVRYKHVDGYEDVYAEHGDWCDGNWDMFCFGHCGEVESILAWMPLPEPYRG